MLTWGESACKHLLYTSTPGITHHQGFIVYEPQPPPPPAANRWGQGGTALGGFSLNTQLIIPTSYLYAINSVILFWNNSSFWTLLDKSDGGEKTGPLCIWSHMTSGRGNSVHTYNQVMTYFLKEQKD